MGFRRPGNHVSGEKGGVEKKQREEVEAKEGRKKGVKAKLDRKKNWLEE